MKMQLGKHAKRQNLGFIIEPAKSLRKYQPDTKKVPRSTLSSQASKSMKIKLGKPPKPQNLGFIIGPAKSQKRFLKDTKKVTATSRPKPPNQCELPILESSSGGPSIQIIMIPRPYTQILVKIIWPPLFCRTRPPQIVSTQDGDCSPSNPLKGI